MPSTAAAAGISRACKRNRLCHRGLLAILHTNASPSRRLIAWWWSAPVRERLLRVDEVDLGAQRGRLAIDEKGRIHPLVDAGDDLAIVGGKAGRFHRQHRLDVAGVV